MTAKKIWVFQGNGADAPGGIFSSRQKAEDWINNTGVEGILFHYPVDVSVYDFLVDAGALKITKEYQTKPRFIQKFSPGYLEHYHYENASDDDDGEAN